MDALLSRVLDGDDEAWVSVVNLAEARYQMLRRAGPDADTFVRYLVDAGVELASADAVWRHASDIKAKRALSLADAFALATARDKDATLVAAGDPDLASADELGVRLLRVG